ncbi:HNH endonuclease [Aliivibrio fischeri]|uniref:HNH endonuclease n=1 Tax=Aliivibrio fischeri TaxID=668 RepID=UPI0012DA5F5D|nr:HNH endonuclease signature motif containing protein [Aliivibrio fischeri]MUK70323.1 HNH endonuclease [Aliivibrio fischeri]MUK72013.1 HNH endonuclease [Aliivibrio fischeri]
MTHQIWSEEEITAAVVSYLEMHHNDKNNIPYRKSHYYQDLSKRFGRTPKAYGRRMSNISYVFTLMELPIVIGLSPLSNVGANHAQLIERLVSEKTNKPFLNICQFEIHTQKILNSKKKPEKPKGNKEPSYLETTTKVYQRSGKIKGWVLRRAGKYCELCKQEAPFKKENGSYYLEVHHLLRLKDGGSDTVENCAALCPNCHRKLHYSQERKMLSRELINLIVKKEGCLQ